MEQYFVALVIDNYTTCVGLQLLWRQYLLDLRMLSVKTRIERLPDRTRVSPLLITTRVKLIPIPIELRLDQYYTTAVNTWIHHRVQMALWTGIEEKPARVIPRESARLVAPMLNSRVSSATYTRQPPARKCTLFHTACINCMKSINKFYAHFLPNAKKRVYVDHCLYALTSLDTL